MKLLLIGLPDQFTDADVIAIQKNLTDLFDLPLKGVVITQDSLICCSVEKNEATSTRPKTTKFMKAVNSILDALHDTDVDAPGVRGEFYSLVVKGIIERPILEVIAMGPQSTVDSLFLQKNKLSSLVEYAKVALAMNI